MTTEVDDVGGTEFAIGDRLLATLFLVGLLHLIVILGITFAPPDRGDEPAPALEVVLVGDELPEAERNPEARYLSRRTQLGAGNTDKADRPQLAPDAGALREQQGEPDGDAEETRQAANNSGGQRTVGTTGSGTSTVYVAATDLADRSTRAADLRLGAQRSAPALDVAPDILLEGPRRGELVVTPSTRESGVAVYLDSWRRKVELIGTVNFPTEARRRRLSGSPVVEIALFADGRLEFARIRRSSGHAELDAAAVDILKLAAPFDPFPRELALQHSRLRFAYEWQFLAGQMAGSAVSAPADP